MSGAFVEIEDLGKFLSTLIPNLGVPDQFGIWPEVDLRCTPPPCCSVCRSRRKTGWYPGRLTTLSGIDLFSQVSVIAITCIIDMVSSKKM